MSYYEDEIYHSGYLDGYYASMELYHADDSEMTDEERRARRKKRRRARAVALGITGAAGLLGGTYLYNEAKYNKELKEDIKGWRAGKTAGKTVGKTVTVKRWKYPKDSIQKRNIHGFRKTSAWIIKAPSTRTYVPTWALERARKHP